MKIILFVVDGMRPDSLENIESAQRIIKKSTYTMNAQTVFPSVTLPCHMSLFHSVAPDRHGTTTNIYMPQVRPVNGLCEVLKLYNKKAPCSIIGKTYVMFPVLTRLHILLFTQAKNWGIWKQVKCLRKSLLAM